MTTSRIAVIGAGLTGTSAALELARRGHPVDLYDECDRPIARASRNNEGKLHVGLVYAADSSARTARAMALGAMTFSQCLARWTDVRPEDWPVSTPFYYAVHRGSMVEIDRLERHYARCQRLVADAGAATGGCYLGGDRALHVERLRQAEAERLVSSDHAMAVYRTSERAIDPRAVAGWLGAAVAAAPLVRFMPNVRVTAVSRRDDGRFDVCFENAAGPGRDIYDRVANTSWHGRLAIDTTAGLSPPQDWIYRYKIGGWVAEAQAATPSVTWVLGPYGDLVNFGERGLYFSWYPAGMVGASRDISPPDWERTLSQTDRETILQQSYEAVRARAIGLASWASVRSKVTAAEGVIFAWGATDIDDRASRLHTRHEIGIHSDRNYHSVNTGKYTMAPYLGMKTAERLLGLA